MLFSNQTHLRRLCYVAIAFCAAYIVSTLVNVGQLFFSETDVEWSSDILGLQILILSGFHAAAIAMFALLIAVICNTLKGLRIGDLFPKSNIGLIYFIAAAATIYRLCGDNIQICKGIREFHFEGRILFIPVTIIIFGMLYKAAYLASTDSNLSI